MNENPAENQVPVSKQSTQVVPPKKSNTFLGFVLGILFILLLGGGLILVFQNKLNPQPISSPLPLVNVSPTTDEAAGWKTFTSEKYGFSINYHPNWFIIETINTVSLLSTDPKNGGNLSGFKVKVLSNDKQLSTKDWWFEQNKPLNEYNQQRYSEFVEFNINGIKGIKLNADARPEGIAMTEVYFANDKWIYNITMSDDEYKQNLNERQINDQILSTFKFTDTSVDTSNWKTYTNSQGNFEFLYPPELVINESNQGGSFQTKSNNRINFYTINDTSSTIGDYLVKADKISQTSYEGQPSLQVQSTKKTVINGLNCIQRKEYLIAADLTQINTYFKKSSFVISIALQPTPGNSLSEDEPMYQQILSTFKFTE